MPFNLKKVDGFWTGSVSYSGYTLESAKNAFVMGSLAIDEFEIVVECILWEEAFPQKIKPSQIHDVWEQSFLSGYVGAALSATSYDPRIPSAPPKPDDSIRSVTPYKSKIGTRRYAH